MNPAQGPVTRSQKKTRAATEGESKTSAELLEARENAAKAAEDELDIQAIRNIERAERAEEAQRVTDHKNLAFKLFPRFPIEIRLQIWKSVCFLGRNVDLRPGMGASVWDRTHSYEEARNRTGMFKATGYRSNSPPPAVLQANQESRAEAMKHYSLEFGIKVDNPYFSFAIPAKIYLNLEVDRICFMDPSWEAVRTWRTNGQSTSSSVKRFGIRMPAVSPRLWERDFMGIVKLADTFSPVLQEVVYFDVPAKYQYSGGTIEFKEPRELLRKAKLDHHMIMTIEKAKETTRWIQQTFNNGRGYGEGLEAKPEVKLMRLWVDGKDKSTKYYLPESPPKEMKKVKVESD